MVALRMLKVRLKSLARKQTIGFSTSVFGNRSTSILEYIITPLIILRLKPGHATRYLYPSTLIQKTKICQQTVSWGFSALALEGVSKPQIAFEGKAKADEKAQHTREYVSILKRLSTQPSSVRWGFEMPYRVLRGVTTLEERSHKPLR
jgi:hypothetical protein